MNAPGLCSSSALSGPLSGPLNGTPQAHHPKKQIPRTAASGTLLSKLESIALKWLQLVITLNLFLGAGRVGRLGRDRSACDGVDASPAARVRARSIVSHFRHQHAHGHETVKVSDFLPPEKTPHARQCPQHRNPMPH